MTAGRTQRSDIRGLRSGIELISDLRLLTSAIDGFYDLNDFNDFNGLPFTAHCLRYALNFPDGVTEGKVMLLFL